MEYIDGSLVTNNFAAWAEVVNLPGIQKAIFSKQYVCYVSYRKPYKVINVMHLVNMVYFDLLLIEFVNQFGTNNSVYV